MLNFVHTAFVWIAPFLFVLTLIVTVHELGHFTAARLLGVAVDQFSIGFGRAVVSWRDKAGILWRIGWLPLGGYVRFSGDENAASLPDADDLAVMRRDIIAREGPEAVAKYFHFKPIWQRAIIVAAGPLANFGLAIVLFAAIMMTVGRPLSPARVASLIAGSPAAAAGFKKGDLILRADAKAIGDFEDVQKFISGNNGNPIRFQVQRGSTLVDIVATPKLTAVNDKLGRKAQGRQLGVQIDAENPVYHRYPPLEALGASVSLTWDVLGTTVYTINEMIHGRFAATNLSGPLGIAQISHSVAQAGAQAGHGLGEKLVGVFVALFSLCGVISVGIGFMNLLPIPVLDGGHLLFYVYEAVARRPVAAAVQTLSYRVGLALLLGLMLFATTNDLQRSSVFHFLGGPFS